MANKQRPPKPFPHRCPECGAAAVYAETTDYKTALKHEGRLHEFVASNVTLNKCRDCGGVILPNTALDQITEAFRSHAALLTAEGIRGELRRLKLSQKEFAELLGVAPETVSRWLTGVQIQSRSLDNLMRLFFKLSDVRRELHALREGGPTPERSNAQCDPSPQLDPISAAGTERQPPPDGFRCSPRFARRCSTTVLERQARFQLIVNLN